MTSGPSSVPDLDLPWAIDYRGLVTALEADGVSVADHLRVELPQTFLDVYADMTARPLNVMVFQHRTFSYVYDHYAALEATGAVVFDQNQESRLVGAVGVSAPHFRARDEPSSSTDFSARLFSSSKVMKKTRSLEAPNWG